MMSKFEQTFAERIEQIIGLDRQIQISGVYYTSNSNVLSEYYYRNSGDSADGKPLLLMLNKGIKTQMKTYELILITSYRDGEKLKEEKINMDEYINTSKFFFGHEWQEGKVEGPYWTSLYESTGLVQIDKIIKFFAMQKCRKSIITGIITGCYYEQNCICDMKICPYNPCSITFDELPKIENGAKSTLFNAVNRKIRKKGYKLEYLRGYGLVSGREYGKIYLHISTIKVNEIGFPSIEAEIPMYILNSVLYNPDQDFDKLIEDYEIVFIL